MKKILALVLFLALLGLSLTVLRFAPGFVHSAAACASVAAFAAGFHSSAAGFRILGLGILTMPLLTFQGLNVFVASWLVGDALRGLFRPNETERPPLQSSQFEAELGFVVLILSLFAAGLRTWRFEFDELLFEEIAGNAGLYGVLRFAAHNPSLWNKVPLLVSGYLLAAFVLAAVSRRGDGGKGLLEGLAAGAILSSGAILLQVIGAFPFPELNRGAFWVLTGRYAGLASDPNAFGVLAGLLAPAFFILRPLRPGLFVAAAVFLIAAAPWSGSRTFWLGLAFGGVYLIWSRAGLSRRRFVAGCAAAAAALLILGEPGLNGALQSKSASPGMSRLLRTINWEEAPEMFASRFSYARIALAVWQKAPLLGVGLGRFYDHQAEAAKAVGIELGTWRDNANNFYLQVLSEAGLFGLALVLFAFVLFLRALRGESHSGPRLAAARYSVAALVVLLITGPHLHFDELKYVFAGLLGAGVWEAARLGDAEVSRARRRIRRLALFVAAGVIVFFVHSGERPPLQGVYAREEGADGPFLWTTSRAHLALCPTDREEVAIEFRALNPDLASNPLDVAFLLERGPNDTEVRRVTVGTNDWRELRLPLGGAAVPGSARRLSVNTSRSWSPSAGGGEGDPRWFGLMLKYPADICPEGAGR